MFGYVRMTPQTGNLKGAQGTGNEKVGTKPNLVPVLVPSFPLSIARYPLHLPHCSSI